MDRQESKTFYFIGNTAYLDFVNTLLLPGNQEVELLEDFADLVSWLVLAGLLEKSRGDEALTKWSGTPEAENTLKQARELRSALRAIVEQITGREAISQIAIQCINTGLASRAGHVELIYEAGIFQKRYYLELTHPVHLLTPLAEAASDFLCHADLSLIKPCQNPRCSLYFYDTTRNHARRWCSMSVCGNRRKSALHYRKVRQDAILDTLRASEREHVSGELVREKPAPDR